MVEDILDEIKKLSPEDRIKKLKELQEKDKKEIEKAQALIKESEEEAVREQEVQNIPIPQIKSVDINSLFTPEEKELFKAKRGISGKLQDISDTDKFDLDKSDKPNKSNKFKHPSLEEVAAKESHKAFLSQEEEHSQVQYLSQLSEKPAVDLYDRMKNIYNDVKSSGYISNSQKQELQNINYANRRKLDAIHSGEYGNVSKETAREMVLTEKMRSWLQDSYGRRADY